jgi:hypothetical protein
MAKAKKTSHSTYISERTSFGTRLELLGILLLIDLVLLSFRNPVIISLGSIISIIIVVIALYSYLLPKNIHMKTRARYMLLFVVLSIFAYYGTHGITKGDTPLMTALGESLVTATSISAVFAGTIYEKMRALTVDHGKKLPKEVVDIVVRLAIYPMVISVIAVFTAILALVFSSSNFIFSIILINATITFVLLTLLTSVELLKEELTRQLER